MKFLLSFPLSNATKVKRILNLEQCQKHSYHKSVFLSYSLSKVIQMYRPT